MAPAADTVEVYRVIESFAFDHNGRGYVMRRGDVVEADHPAYTKARAHLFEPVASAAAAAARQARDSWHASEEAVAHPRGRRTLSHPEPPEEPQQPETDAAAGTAEGADSAVEAPSDPSPGSEPQGAPEHTSAPEPTPQTGRRRAAAKRQG